MFVGAAEEAEGAVVRFDAVHLSINLVSEIAVPMLPTLTGF